MTTSVAGDLSWNIRTENEQEVSLNHSELILQFNINIDSLI